MHPPVIEPVGSRPVGVPIYQGHLFTLDTGGDLAAAFQGPDEAFFYGRMGNPTVRSLERAVTELEGGAGALAASSGMGAISTVLTGLLGAGDHVIAQTALYGGTYALLQDLAGRWGVDVTYIPGDDPAEVAEALRPTTRLLYLETVANPTTHVTDLPAFTAALQGTDVSTVVDNTFTPLLCKPIEHGRGIVVHSTTKYLSGHGDVVGGIAVFADPDVRHRVWKRLPRPGVTAAPFAAWLDHPRPPRCRSAWPPSASALDIAGRLAAHPSVTPSLPRRWRPPAARDGRRLSATGAGPAFQLAGGRDAGGAFSSPSGSSGWPVARRRRVAGLYPASTSHRQMDAASLAAAGIGEGTVRLSIGLEHPDDLWADIEQALAKAT